MIRFAVPRGRGTTLDSVAADPDAPRLRRVAYERLLRARGLSRDTTVFTSLDRLSPFDLERAAALHRCLAEDRVAVLNDPARVKTRYALLRALHEAGLNEFNAYRLEEALRPARYPVFLRRDRGHGAPLTGLLDDWDAVRREGESAIASGVPESSIIVVEYAAEPARPGIFRKLALGRVGARLVPQVCVHDGHWLVKYGKQGFATPELYEEELRILREMPYAEPVQRAFEIAGIEYGRADFGLVGGRVQVYEINTNPSLQPGRAHPSRVREQSLRLAWDALLAALRELDAAGTRGGRVRIRDERLRSQQGWWRRLPLGRRRPRRTRADRPDLR